MAENIPPASSTSAQNQQASSTATADQPGRPYYESLRSSLRQTLDKKRKLDEQLSALEDNIFKMESAYLEETAASGNIVRGFDGWVKGVSVGGGRGEPVRKGRVRDEERVFSRGSVSWMRSQEGPDSNTPSHAPTPTGSFAPAASAAGTPAASGSAAGGGNSKNNKKKRPNERDADGEEDGKGNKRGKISYSRD